MPSQPTELEIEIAAAAARLIAENGFDYATAKRKAARELGDGGRRALPDNAVVENELRRYLALFDEFHLERLAALRAVALLWMERLAAHQPHLVGAVLNGTATEHSDVHLHLFADSAKDVEMRLLDAGVDFTVDEGDEAPGGAVEVIRFVAPSGHAILGARVGIVLSVHDTDAVRTAPRHRSSAAGLHPIEASGRAGMAALRQLLAEQSA